VIVSVESAAEHRTSSPSPQHILHRTASRQTIRIGSSLSSGCSSGCPSAVFLRAVSPRRSPHNTGFTHPAETVDLSFLFLSVRAACSQPAKEPFEKAGAALEEPVGWLAGWLVRSDGTWDPAGQSHPHWPPPARPRPAPVLSSHPAEETPLSVLTYARRREKEKRKKSRLLGCRAVWVIAIICFHRSTSCWRRHSVESRYRTRS